MSLARSASPGTASRQQEHLISGWRLLLTVALMLVIGGGAGIVTWRIVHIIAPAWTSTVDFVVLVVAEAYAAILAALVLAFGGLSGVRDQLGLRLTSGRDLLRALGLDILALLGAIVFYVLFTPIFGPPLTIALPVLKSVTDVTRLPHADLLTLVLIFGRVFLLVPLAEELFFRGALYGWLRRHQGGLPTNLITAVLFGFEHTAWGLPMPRVFFLVPLAFVYGIAVGWVREQTGSTLNTAVMHVVVDAALLIVASLLILRYGQFGHWSALLSKATHQQANHGYLDERFAGLHFALVVLSHAPVSGQRRERTFYYPPFGPDSESTYTRWTLYDFEIPVAHGLAPVGQVLAPVGSVSPDYLQPWNEFLALPAARTTCHFLLSCGCDDPPAPIRAVATATVWLGGEQAPAKGENEAKHDGWRALTRGRSSRME